MPKPPKRPRDLNKLATSIVDEATNESVVPELDDKNPAAVELGRLGGLRGGKARAAKMTKAQRSESARKAAQARWARRSGI